MAIQRMKKLIGKGIASLKRNGIRITLLRVRRKLMYSSPNLRKVVYGAYREAELDEQRRTDFPRQVKFSILVPLYNTPIPFLKEMIASVQSQTYSNWELCLADGSDDDQRQVEMVVKEYAAKDARIKYFRLRENRGISGNTNACIALATGEYISLFDHDDILHPAALFETLRAICETDADFIYTDEVTFESPDIRNLVSLHLKPDYAPDNLKANNYICHFTSFSRALLERTGMFRTEFDGSQDHDMILRLTAKAERIVHVPKVLYFWRSHAKSVAMDIGAKTYAISAGQRAVSEAVRASGYEAEVSSSEIFAAIYRLKYRLRTNYKVSIIIYDVGGWDALCRCIESIQTHTTYSDYEILILGAEERFDDEKIHCVSFENGGFSLNKAAKCASGDVLVFLSPNAEIVTPEWLEELLMYAQRDDVGAVGPVMVRNDNTLWHTGMVLGLGADGLPGEAFQTFPHGFDGYMGRLAYAQNVSALSGDCLMIRKDLFLTAGGFDLSLSGDLGAVDLCLKLRDRGLVHVWTPFSCLKITPRAANTDAERNIFARKWKHFLSMPDPYYNPIFSTEGEGFRITPEK